MKNKIKVYRAMHDMTQEELAELLRVTRRTVNSIEGDKYNPSIEVAFRIAKLFNVPVEEIFSLDED
jgi:putative transcriptional regulator